MLAALSNSSDKWISVLFEQLSTFSFTFSSSLRIHGHGGPNYLEPSTADINHAYIAVKLWILLARRKTLLAGSSLDNTTVASGTGRVGYMEEITVWNELWPVFEGLMNGFEAETQTGNLSVSKSHPG